MNNKSSGNVAGQGHLGSPVNINTKYLIHLSRGYMRYFLFLLVGLFVVGCVTTDFFSKLNPAHPPGVQYQRILIYFLDAQGDYAEFGEETTKQQIAKVFGPSIQCYLYSKEFFTGLVVSPQIKEDIHNFETAKNIDAVIICTGARGKQTNAGWNTVNGMSMYHNDEQNIVGYRMELIDLKVGKAVWYSTDKASGSSLLNSDKDLVAGFIERAVLDMKLNQLLGVDDRPSPFVTPVLPAAKTAI